MYCRGRETTLMPSTVAASTAATDRNFDSGSSTRPLIAPLWHTILFIAIFGLLALWRKSLRAGMIAHAWSDIFGVIIFRGA